MRAVEPRAVARVLLGLFFVASGVNHFVHFAFYVRIVPSYLPEHAALVEISGICECLGGIGALISPLRRLAAAGLVALLIAVFPANVDMALHAGRYSDIAPGWALYVRLPVQLALIAWVWWAAGGVRAAG